MRHFILLSFDGTAYHGWQIQENAHTVQAELNKSLSILFQNDIQSLGCGRTDTGVHAKNFYVHFDAEIKEENYPNFIHQLNCLLPFDIAVKSIHRVHPDAHVRFDATSRTYEYSIHDFKNPFLRNTSWFYPHKLDIDLMNELSNCLMLYQDFSCFSKSRTQTATNNCTITEAVWIISENNLIFRITANRFLRNMVRAIVGTLVEGGRGRLSKLQFEEILKSKNRSEAGPSVPAHGLSLVDIQYPYLP